MIVSVTVAPEFNVRGKVAPATEKPAPETVAEETVTAVVPFDERMTDCVVDDPTTTVPKFSVVELSVSCGFDAATPVPDSVTIEVPPVVALLLIVILPVTAPAVFGAKVICAVSE